MNKAEEKKVYPACRIEDRTVCPSHPGVILKDIYLHDLNLTVKDFAERIGVTRKTVSAIVNGKASVTPEMAFRFSAALGTRPQKWLDLQRNYDIWHTAHDKTFIEKISKIAAVW